MSIGLMSEVSTTVVASVGVVLLSLLGILVIFLCLDNQPRNMMVERQPSRDKDAKVMSDDNPETLLFVDENIEAAAGRDSDTRMPSRFQGESYVEGSQTESRGIGSYFETGNQIKVKKGQFPKIPLRVTKKKKIVPQSYAEY